MSFLLRFEAACAAFVENTFARVFPSELEPRHIARKLVATMESTPADTYLVHVHPRDFHRLGPHRAALERQWGHLLTQLAGRLGLAVGGPVRVVLQDDAAVVAGSLLVEAVAENEAERPLVLEVESVAAGTQHHPIRAEFSIGRASDNDLVIADPSISRYHALARSVDGGMELEDRNSSNGLVVDGARLRRVTLAPGDVAYLGDARLRVARPT